jgi:hypothetical protein
MQHSACPTNSGGFVALATHRLPLQEPTTIATLEDALSGCF